MAATNINRVDPHRQPDPRSRAALAAERHVASARCASPSNTRRKDGQSGEWIDKPNYFDVTVWGAQGENCARFLSKGRPVAIDGRLEWREWQDQDGQKRQTVEIIADSVQFLGGRDGAGGGSGGDGFTPQSDVPVDTARLPAAPARRRGGGSAPARRRHPVLGRRRLRPACGTPERSLPAPLPRASARRARRGASATMDRPRPPARADSCAPAAPRDKQHTKGLRKWQSSAAGRRAGGTRRAGPAPAAASPARTARTRSSTSTTRTSPPCASSSPSAARSARAASPAPAAATRTRSRPPSSALASWRCCPTSPRRARPRRARPAAPRSRPRPRPLARDAPGDPAPGRRDARREGRRRRRLQGLPAQLPDPAQAGRARHQGLDRGRQAAARRPPSAPSREATSKAARQRRAAQQDRADDHATRPATTAACSAPSPRRTSPTRSARPAASRIDSRKVHLDEPIKTVGTHMVTVEVAAGVTATSRPWSSKQK